jgi:hypothetical protein
MLAQVPTGQPPLVWKKSVHAGPGLGRIESHRSFPVLLEHGSVVVHHDRAVGVAFGRRSRPENDIVESVGQGSRPERSQNDSDEDSSQSHPQIGGSLTHDARLYAFAPPHRRLSGGHPAPPRRGRGRPRGSRQDAGVRWAARPDKSGHYYSASRTYSAYSAIPPCPAPIRAHPGHPALTT